ncbi:MAG TPA: hypothetical protein VLK26_01805 [Rudaea sp.]|nr:hypothetical protein [Rudaea sp.]
MSTSKYLIALAIAISITGLEFVGLSVLASSAGRPARQVFVVPQATLPMLPVITVRPTHQEVLAAFAGRDLASTAHPDYSMPFYSFAAKPAAANKG